MDIGEVHGAIHRKLKGVSSFTFFNVDNDIMHIGLNGGIVQNALHISESWSNLSG